MKKSSILLIAVLIVSSFGPINSKGQTCDNPCDPLDAQSKCCWKQWCPLLYSYKGCSQFGNSVTCTTYASCNVWGGDEEL
jgi:hypothetical protein